MKRAVLIIGIILIARGAFAESDKMDFTLSEVIDFALKNNPGIRSSRSDIEIENYGIKAAKAAKWPKVDLSSGVTRYRYPSPITPIAGSPLAGAAFPEFDKTIYDASVVFSLPFYRGGRLDREVQIAELRRAIAEDTFHMNRQELIYNLTSVYYKIYELEKLLAANESSVQQLVTHKKNIELFLEAGTVPRVDLLKTEAALAHAQQTALLTRNSLASTYELLKALMGIEDATKRITLVYEQLECDRYQLLEDSIAQAFLQRPDYKAALKQQRIAEERIKLARGKRIPAVSLNGEYNERSGEDLSFNENWNLSVRITMPLFDGGAITAEVHRQEKELAKSEEEMRFLRLAIIREVKDAYLNIQSAQERIEATRKAIDSAQETLRIERLKYDSGKGTSTDVIDAQTALLRAETDYYQALYDKDIAVAALQKAMGEERYGKEEVR
ncbi:MAG: TolC family protein [Nitrospirota bacterium]